MKTSSAHSPWRLKFANWYGCGNFFGECFGSGIGRHLGERRSDFSSRAPQRSQWLAASPSPAVRAWSARVLGFTSSARVQSPGLAGISVFSKSKGSPGGEPCAVFCSFRVAQEARMSRKIFAFYSLPNQQVSRSEKDFQLATCDLSK